MTNHSNERTGLVLLTVLGLDFFDLSSLSQFHILLLVYLVYLGTSILRIECRCFTRRLGKSNERGVVVFVPLLDLEKKSSGSGVGTHGAQILAFPQATDILRKLGSAGLAFA
jgi:hypothetical protein